MNLVSRLKLFGLKIAVPKQVNVNADEFEQMAHCTTESLSVAAT